MGHNLHKLEFVKFFFKKVKYPAVGLPSRGGGANLDGDYQPPSGNFGKLARTPPKTELERERRKSSLWNALSLLREGSGEGEYKITKKSEGRGEQWEQESGGPRTFTFLVPSFRALSFHPCPSSVVTCAADVI